MKRILNWTLIFVWVVACCALAQEAGNVTIQTAPGAGHVNAFAFGAMGAPGPAVKGAPYSATITNESVQTLADGTHITQSSSGSTARDAQGRTRQDAPLPAIGNLSAADAPHLVFVRDPVAGTSYTLNLTDKTAWKNPLLAGEPGGVNVMTSTVSANAVYVHTGEAGPGELPPPPPSPMPGQVFLQKRIIADDSADVTTENLRARSAMIGPSLLQPRCGLRPN
jgi:hypothetical protein